MLFTEIRFFWAFLLLLVVYWTLRSHAWRKRVVLLFSFFFYACFFIGPPAEFSGTVLSRLTGESAEPLPQGWWFPGMLVFSIVMDYVVGLRLESATTSRRRRLWIMLSLCMNLGVLIAFKYAGFITESAGQFLSWFGLPTHDWTLKVLLPYGISFYTFQSMSYSIEVYRGKIPAVRNFWDLAFFVSFFPQLVAGPIVRATHFLPQMATARRWASVDVRGACVQFFVGFFKKACLSALLAPLADDVFGQPLQYQATAIMIGVMAYAAQIYCDFSGYTDMALATSRLLGYDLSPNFASPYVAHSITDFWRRWHMSLSSWLRDYLYIPLGGNRGSLITSYRNVMITMILGGLWHGNTWNFVWWGALHGAALVAHREWGRARLRWSGLNGFITRLPAWLWHSAATFLTFYWVCITWIFFRAQPIPTTATHESASGIEVAWTLLKIFMGADTDGKKRFGPGALPILLILGAIHIIASRGLWAQWWQRTPPLIQAFLLGLGVAAALALQSQEYTPFIYFQF
jgi:alginate O-acetyltransferase complex protein AlgI